MYKFGSELVTTWECSPGLAIIITQKFSGMSYT